MVLMFSLEKPERGEFGLDSKTAVPRQLGITGLEQSLDRHILLSSTWVGDFPTSTGITILPPDHCS